MNETKLSLRQKKILTIISQNLLSREQISQSLADIYPVSKITLIRDLNHLVKMGLIEKSGAGNNYSYHLTENHPLLNYIDIKEYFNNQSGRDRPEKISFNFNIFSQLKNLITPRDLKEYDIIDLKLTDQEKKLDPTIFRREIERFVIEFSWKSSKIEGNTYSLLETEILIKQSIEAPGHSRYEAVMILNHKMAFEYILKSRIEFKVISPPQIINLHAILIKNLEVTSGIRHNPVAISGTNYEPLPSGKEIDRVLSQFIKIVNKSPFPLEKALITLACVSYIQPFNDGNKRLARVLANAILIAYDRYPVSFRQVEPTDFLKALLLFYETNNLFHLKKIFLEQYNFAQHNYFRA